MEEISLSIAFGDSSEEETVACISEYAELGLDAMYYDIISAFNHLDAIERSPSTRLSPKR